MTTIRRIDFLRDKYGPELLVDVGYIHDLEGFLVDGPPHRLSFYDIMLVTRGEGPLWLDTYRHEVGPGRVVFSSPGTVRRWSIPRLDGICLFFTREFIGEFFNDPLFLHRLRYFHEVNGAGVLELDPGEGKALRGRLESMTSEIGSLQGDSAHLLRAGLYEVLITLNRQYVAEHGPAVGEAAEAFPAAFEYRGLVERHHHQEHRVAAYAARLGVTPGHLNHLSKRHLGVTAGQVVRERIVVEAKRLLMHTERTTARIARELGFVDPSYFSRFYKRETGESPASYRRRAWQDLVVGPLEGCTKDGKRVSRSRGRATATATDPGALQVRS